MTQGDASTYQTMIDNSTMQTRSQQMVGRAFGSAQGGTTQNGQQQGMAPSAAQGGAPPAAPDAVMGAQLIAPVTHGILYEVGNDYIALYQPDEQSYISADLYSIRFMEFLPEISQTNSRQQQQP